MNADAGTVRNAITTLLPQVGSAVEFLNARQSGQWTPGRENIIGDATAGLREQVTQARRVIVVTDVYIDPEDEFIDALKVHCGELWDLDVRLQRSGPSADSQRYLVGSLAEECKELRAAIISHDLKAEPGPSELFDSLDVLMYKRFRKDCDKLDKPNELDKLEKLDKVDKRETLKTLNRDRVHGALFKLLSTNPLPFDRLEVLERDPQIIYGFVAMQDLKVSLSVVCAVPILRRVDSPDGIRRAP